VRLEGVRTLVTGGASGIGDAIVRRFREEGAEVVVADLRGGELELDVRDRASVERATVATVERLGGLDAVVCSAGRPVVGTVAELDEADWDDGIDTNLKGIFLTAKAAWPHLAESAGSITSIASIVGLWGSGGQAAYCASKAGVVMLTKCMALDGAKQGIRANCVCPGFTETPMLDRFMSEQADPDGARAAAVGLHPLGRLGTPADIAEAVVYLSSREAQWVTGTALVVDGGLTSGIWG
jgi:NAD(P)-dependent dehydrogenase (short-subunit alcohol dehydrogenase family)